jgi:ketosteroid isomerase-like protein
MSLADADPTLRTWFLAWLDRFSGFVRDVDFAAARPMWHPDVIVFGTHQDLVQGRERAIASQWSSVWPRTADFRFELEKVRVLAAPGGSLVVVIAPWTSTGFTPDGKPFARPGRATLVFQRDEAAPEPAWLVVHSHMSLHRGVPQESFADRPVKAP